MSDTHYDVLEDIASEEWDFRREFIRAAVGADKAEQVDKHPFAYAMGAQVEYTGNYFCNFCDRYLKKRVCDTYKQHARDRFRERVLLEYMEPHCPECEEPIEDTRQAEVFEPEASPVSESGRFDPTEIEEFSHSTKKATEYQPCGCHREVGEEEILWDLDKEQLDHDSRHGIFWGYNGPAFKRGTGLSTRTTNTDL